MKNKKHLEEFDVIIKTDVQNGFIKFFSDLYKEIRALEKVNEVDEPIHTGHSKDDGKLKD